jgi:hypothetical protein
MEIGRLSTYADSTRTEIVRPQWDLKVFKISGGKAAQRKVAEREALEHISEAEKRRKRKREKGGKKVGKNSGKWRERGEGAVGKVPGRGRGEELPRLRGSLPLAPALRVESSWRETKRKCLRDPGPEEAERSLKIRNLATPSCRKIEIHVGPVAPVVVPL